MRGVDAHIRMKWSDILKKDSHYLLKNYRTATSDGVIFERECEVWEGHRASRMHRPRRL